MTKIAIYPGSFDPITYGHIDLIKRAAKIFKKVVVAVADNSSKDSLFTVKERVALIEQVTADLGNIEVDSFKGLSIDYVRSKGSYVIIRGVRMISDFEYEFQMALTNRRLSKSVETIFLMPNESYSYISSKLIKEAASLGADISCFVPKVVVSAIQKKLLKKKKRMRC
ncbi:MAG: pantetheine-phosphate adenylyltransferase [Candidatus Orphnella occulta]|nr:pantetheine-phosphate adenylyltransferase [Candidatus Orphnella occulta]MDP8296577.1 pantetheine-phosphate adenylyltransferase [Candidatus Orphnella occulta]